MISVNMHEAKTNLSKLVDAAQKGEKVVICRAGKVVAEIKGVPLERTEPRVPGAWKGLIPKEELDYLTRPWTDEEIAEFTEGPIFPDGKS